MQDLGRIEAKQQTAMHAYCTRSRQHTLVITLISTCQRPAALVVAILIEAVRNQQTVATKQALSTDQPRRSLQPACPCRAPGACAGELGMVSSVGGEEVHNADL